jgi:hypothetical protein
MLELDRLSEWLDSPGPARALILEDGCAGSVSPVARWLEAVRAAVTYEVIATSIGPEAGRVLERDILVDLFLQLQPTNRAASAAFSLRQLRDHVRFGLPADASEGPRLVAIDRVSWAEQSFREGLGLLLDRVGPEQKIVVSVRVDDERDPGFAGWCEQLGWSVGQTLCLRLPALPDGELPPAQRARAWVGACQSIEGAEGASLLQVLDLLADAQRSMGTDEVASILDLETRVVEASLRRAPERSIAVDPSGRWAFRDPTCARAWGGLRAEAAAQVRERILALGDAVLCGEAGSIAPYVIEQYGSLLGERRGAGAQVALVGERWARAWSSIGTLLGFDADIERGLSAARGGLAATVAEGAERRAEPLLALFRGVQAADSTLWHMGGFGDRAAARAKVLLALAGELAPPQRTRIRACAVDTLLGAADLSIPDAQLLVPLATSFDGPRRDAIVEKVLSVHRANIEDGGTSLWLVGVAPLLSEAERRDLCNEITAPLRAVSDLDAQILRSGLETAPPGFALQLARAAPALPPPDRLRFECALAPYLDMDLRQRTLEQIVETVEASDFPADTRACELIAPELGAEQVIRLFRALRAQGDRVGNLVFCLRALCALGQASAAESLAGSDLDAMPFDCLLALASGAPPARAALREAVARRLAAFDEIDRAWTIARGVAELVTVLGVDALIELARAISADEERIVSRIALAPFADETWKRALVTEAVQTLRTSTAGGNLHEEELMSCLPWMTPVDACYLVTRGSQEEYALSMLERLAPHLKRLGGSDLPSRLADQVVDVGRWAP